MTKKVIFLEDERYRSMAEQLSAQESVSIIETLPHPDSSEAGLRINFEAQGVSIQGFGEYATNKVQVDFVGGSLSRRSQHKHLHGEMVAKAVGIKKHPNSKVFDATTGLARDSFILATLGCQMDMMEQSNIIACLIVDGLKRGQDENELAATMARMNFKQGNSLDYMQAQRDNELLRPDVVYLDPMFPDRQKTALAKKEMRLFQLFGLDEESDLDLMLEAATRFAKRHVVLKRPLKAAPLNHFRPSHSISGRSCRFDVYVAVG
ncbi:MAG: class I SAM-dependent methyltransferase [Gammaproteobacteria bacterium]|nr:class I SAM-dependent methyltransferase [Gammaproteobacteria bacterium]